MKGEESDFQYQVGHHDNGQIEQEIYSNNEHSRSNVISYYENGQKRQEYFVNYNKQGFEVYNGPEASWYPSGQKESELNYKDGNLNGKAIYWYESGIKKSQANYKDFKQEGVYNEWHKSGQLRFEAYYENGCITKVYEWDKYGNSVSGLPGIFALKEDYDMKDTPIEKSDDGLFNEYTSAELDLMSKKADKGDIESW